MVLAVMTFISACATTVPSGTNAACAALRPYLPMVSAQDTDQTQDEVLVFYDVFAEVCS